jgi:hypothetical protein
MQRKHGLAITDTSALERFVTGFEFDVIMEDIMEDDNFQPITAE